MNALKNLMNGRTHGTQESGQKDAVVLLHGILDNKKKMFLMARQMQKAGYEVINLSYPSTRHNLEELSAQLHETLQDDGRFHKAGKVHFVGHSMGGLITRYYLHEYRPPHLGRVVMIGTPNSGSEFADLFHGHEKLRPLFERICGPAGAQLCTTHEHDKAMKIDYEVGVIAGSSSINPLAPFVLNGDNDGTVPVESTKIDGMADHIIMPTTHVFMTYNPKVREQVLHFISHGKFSHAPAPQQNPAPGL